MKFCQYTQRALPNLSNHSLSGNSQMKGPQAHPFDHKTVTNLPILGNSDAAMLKESPVRRP